MKRYSLYVMVGLYCFAGLYHFVNPEFYYRVMPGWLPYPIFLNILSGVAEVICAIGLLFSKTRNLSIWLIILMLAAFALFIHLPMAVDFYNTENPYLWLAILRLPLQIVLIGWAWSLRDNVELRMQNAE